MLAASRFTDSKKFRPMLRTNLDLIRIKVPTMLSAPVVYEVLDDRCVILAEPSIEGGRVSRKGVLLVSFTETSGQLFVSVNRERLFKLFHLVLEPSWAGYADPSILCWLNYPEPVIVQATELHDRELLAALNGNLVPVPYGAGDWIDPTRFFPVKSDAILSYDAICVANYGWWKRVHAFIRAVAHAASEIPSYRAALVMAGLGKTPLQVQRLNSLIKSHGIAANIDVLEGLGQEELNRLFSVGGVLVFTSWKEGSSRVIYEAMCADMPVIVLARNIGVNKDYINKDTGLIVSDKELGKALISVYRSRFQTSPRQWFIENIGPWNTTAKLAADLGRIFPDEGWTSDDVLVKANIPEAKIISPNGKPRPLSYWLQSGKA